MRKLFVCVLALMGLTVAMAATPQGVSTLTGRWSFEQAHTNAQGDEKVFGFLLDLKVENDVITGTVKMTDKCGKEQTSVINDGKLTGDSFTFVTKFAMEKRGEQVTVTWQGTLDKAKGVLKGKQMRERRRGLPFEAYPAK